LIFIPSKLVNASFVAILLSVGCGGSDNPSRPQGAAGQDGEIGGRGDQAAQSGGQAGQSGQDDGQSGVGGNESAGAGGEAGGIGDGPGTSSGGSGASGASGTSGAGSTGGHSGGPAMGGSAAMGGSSARGECAWDPAAVDKCAACDGNAECAQPGYKYVGSGAITSSCCGLVWQEETAPGKYSWHDANEFCRTLSLLGSGWRLPSIAELFSLVELSDESHTLPTINAEAFSDTVREVYWSSSPSSDSGQAAWTVNFRDGTSNETDHEDPQRVRCVR